MSKNFIESFESHNEVSSGSAKQFGYVFTAVFLGLGYILFKKHGESKQFLWLGSFALAPTMLSLALFRPQFLTKPNELWMKFAAFLAAITNPIILGILFYAVLTPMSVLIRFFGLSSIQKRPSKAQDSYWKSCKKIEERPEDMLVQF